VKLSYEDLTDGTSISRGNLPKAIRGLEVEDLIKRTGTSRSKQTFRITDEAFRASPLSRGQSNATDTQNGCQSSPRSGVYRSPRTGGEISTSLKKDLKERSTTTPPADLPELSMYLNSILEPRVRREEGEAAKEILRDGKVLPEQFDQCVKFLVDQGKTLKGEPLERVCAYLSFHLGKVLERLHSKPQVLPPPQSVSCQSPTLTLEEMEREVIELEQKHPTFAGPLRRAYEKRKARESGNGKGSASNKLHAS
jgi:hypothetical protein